MVNEGTMGRQERCFQWGDFRLSLKEKHKDFPKEKDQPMGKGLVHQESSMEWEKERGVVMWKNHPLPVGF